MAGHNQEIQSFLYLLVVLGFFIIKNQQKGW